MATEISPIRHPAYVKPGFLFVILLLAGWPLQKILSLNPGQRFRRRDGLLFLICGMVLTSMLTCLLLDFYYDSLWDAETDRRLTETADHISRNFKAELNSAYDKLVLLDDPIMNAANELKEDCVKAGDKVPDGKSLPNVLVNRKDFPFETADWLNQNGMQRIRWSIKDKVGSFGSRKDRSYFKELKHGNLPSIAGKQFSLQRLYSWDDGTDLTVMGIAMKQPGPACLTTRVGGFHAISVGPIVLPPNIRFAVVDSSGLVLYHSDATRVQVENFLDECERTRQAVAAHVRMAARKECTEPPSEECAAFEAEYEGKPQRMYVRELSVNALPWSVIVFADASNMEMQEGGVLRLALLLFLAYAVTIAALLFLLHANRRSWWVAPPWHEVPARLAGIFALLLCVIVLFAVFIVSSRISVVFFGAFLCPILAIAAAAIALTEKTKLPLWLNQAKNPSVWPVLSLTQLGWPQFSAAAGLVILLSILPPFAFWKVAFTLQKETVIRQGQIELANNLELRGQALAKLYENVRFTSATGEDREQKNDEARDRFLDLRDPWISEKAEFSDLYYPAFYGSTVKAEADGCPSDPGPIERLEQHFRWLPRHFENAEDHKWTRCGGLLTLGRTDSAPPVISSTMPSPPLSASGKVLAETAALLLVFCALMYFAIYRLLYLDRSSVLAADSNNLQTRLVRNLLLIGAPSSGKTALLRKQADLRIINLFEQTPDSLIALAAQSPWPDTPGNFGIDQLEFGIDDPKWNSAVLSLLERFVYGPKTVVVVSNVNPLVYMGSGSFGFLGSGMDDLSSRAQLERWVDLLASFQVRDFGLNEDFAINPGESAQTYQNIWRSCSRQERAVLLNLAQYGLVNPKSRPLLDDLQRRQILVKNPILCFRDPNLGVFLRRVYGRGQLLRWDQALSTGSGVSFWNLLLGLLVLVGIAMSFTGYDALGPVVASISGAINLLMTVKNQIAGQAPKTDLKIA
jgi:hypothetical protein